MMCDEKAKMTGAALLREYLRTNIDTFYGAETNPGKKWMEHLEIEQEILSRFRAGEKAKAEVEALHERVAGLEAWKTNALAFLEKAETPRHYFHPERFGGDDCGFCGNNFRHVSHWRQGESAKTDRAEARALIDAAREGEKEKET